MSEGTYRVDRANLHNVRKQISGHLDDIDDRLITSVVTLTDGSLALTNDNDILLVDATNQPVLVKLPDPALATKSFVVKKIDSTSNLVTLAGHDGEDIDDELARLVVEQYDTIKVTTDGTNWWRLYHYIASDVIYNVVNGTDNVMNSTDNVVT